MREFKPFFLEHWRRVLPLEESALRSEDASDAKARLCAEWRVWGIESNPYATSGASVTLPDVPPRGGTFWPILPEQWRTLFYVWRCCHRHELAARGFEKRARLRFEESAAFDPTPGDPLAFCVWLEWLEENPARLLHWQRWRAFFGDVLAAGVVYEAAYQAAGYNPDLDPDATSARAAILSAFEQLRGGVAA